MAMGDAEVTSVATNAATDDRDDSRRSSRPRARAASHVTTVTRREAQLRITPTKSKPKSEQKKKRLSNRKHSDTPRVEAVKQSRYTWSLRLRWNSRAGRPIQYASRVSDSVWHAITSDKERYAAFKQQLIAQTDPGSIRPGH